MFLYFQFICSLILVAQPEEIRTENTFLDYLKTEQIYIINSVEDLISISQNVYTLSRQYVLGVDLDLSGVSSTENGEGFKPIGSTAMPFRGSFDGNGHKITGLYINRPEESNVGLFGVIEAEAEIKNLAIENAFIAGKENTGIIVGKNKGTVKNSCAVGVVTGNKATGVFVGQNLGSIEDTFAMGFVKGDIWTGGLVGRNEGGLIRRTYFVGKILGNFYFGGLVGINNNGSISYSYWDTQISGISFSSGGTGKITSEMFNKLTYQTWNFNSIWGIRENLNYPYLQVLKEYSYPEPPIIEIASAEDLSKIGKDINYPWYGNYILVNNITLNNENTLDLSPLNPIPSFNGSFNGRGFSIVGLKINLPQKDYIALFSHLFYGGKIQNVIIENCEIKGDYIVGGLVSFNEGGIIEKCIVKGKVIGNYRTGGVVGWNYKGSISQCLSEGFIVTQDEGGGFVGSNFSHITNCYSYMHIEGLFNIGGFSGYNSGTIAYCYSTGKVSGYTNIGGFNGRNEKGNIISCYWDKETSETISSSGGLGRTTNQMKNKDTYYGWDFTEVWYIKPGETYPILRWTGNFTGDGETSEEGEEGEEGEGLLEGSIEGDGASEGISEGPVEGSEEGVIQEGSSEGTYIEGETEGQEGIQEGELDGSSGEETPEGEGESSTQPTDKRCGCWNYDNNTHLRFIFDLLFLGIIILLTAIVRNEKSL